MNIKLFAVGLIIFVVLFISISFRESDDLRAGIVCWREGYCIDVEVMESERARRKGLMYRDFLRDDAGALLIFDSPGIHGEWMRNMKFPTDFIWLDEEKVVIHMHENLTPCGGGACQVYYTPKPALYGIEVNAGHSRKNNLSVGDVVEILI